MITATWIAVVVIFLLAGLGLQPQEFQQALCNVKFNVTVQAFSFLLMSFLVYGLSLGLEAAHLLSADLTDGLVVCSTLPMAINLVIVLTKVSVGDEAASIVNPVLGNFIGIALSPLLILGYLGDKGDLH